MSKEAKRVKQSVNGTKEKNYSDEFYTPANYTSPLGPFGIDPCAGPNTLAAVNYDYAGRGEDGLALPWHGMAWVNPPYSLKGEFLEKLSAHGEGFALVPNTTESVWWQRSANQCDAFLLLQGRVSFRDPDGRRLPGNTKGSTIFAFGQEAVHRLEKAVAAGKLKGFLVRK